MNTRSQSINNSRGRGRSTSDSRNNISIEIWDPPATSKPPVVHSPVVRNIQTQPQLVFQSQSCNNSTSNVETDNIPTMNNPNSLPQPFSTSEASNISLSGNTNEQPRPSASGLNLGNSTTLDTLISMMERTMQNTRDEFRKELLSIRESISQFGNVGSAGSQGQPVNPPIYNDSNNGPNHDLNRSYGTNTSIGDSNIKIEKWKISYDGSSSALDFLFKVETLCNRTRCSDAHLLSNFHVLLTGKAEKWYWLFMKQNRNVTYPILRDALNKEFDHFETEHDILLKLSSRKQQHKESYDDFHSTLVSLNLRLKNPLPDSTLVDIIKRNLQPSLRFLVFSSETKTLNDFRDVARKAERVLRDNKNLPSYSGSTRSVNEVATSNEIDLDVSDTLDPQLEAFKISNRTNKYDYSNINCWNCLSKGHSYIYCDKDISERFCFKCGQKGVLTPSCPNKHPFQGNKRLGEMATGDFRPTRTTPSSN